MGPNRTVKRTRQLDRNRRRAILANIQEKVEDPQHWKQLKLLGLQSSMKANCDQRSLESSVMMGSCDERWQSNELNVPKPMLIRPPKPITTINEIPKGKMKRLLKNKLQPTFDRAEEATKRERYATPTSMLPPDATALPNPIDEWMKEARDQFIQGYDEVDYVEWMKPKDSPHQENQC